MSHYIRSIILICLLLPFAGKSQIITTVAGLGTWGYNGDGGPATNGALCNPYAITCDKAGNLYVAEITNYIIRKVSASGIITTIGGSGVSGFSGDGGPATNATITKPYGIAVDTNGNVYFSDYDNGLIRKIDTNGIITRFAGGGSLGMWIPPALLRREAEPATNARLFYPAGIATDKKGNLFIAEAGGNCILVVTKAGILHHLAGNGGGGSYTGDGGPATVAELHKPWDVTADAAGNLYVADVGNNVIRKINPSGIISTYAGNQAMGFSGDGGPAIKAQFNGPTAIKSDDSGNVYIADRMNDRIRKINTKGIISTVAGNGSRGYAGDGGLATEASLDRPLGVAIAKTGHLYIGDFYSCVVRKVTPKPNTAGVAESGIKMTDLKVYPNPNNGVFTMTCTMSHTEGTANVNIVNMAGQVVHQVSARVENGVMSAQINTAHLPAGQYVIYQTMEDEVNIGRFTKQ